MKPPKKIYLDSFGINNFDYGLSCNCFSEKLGNDVAYISVEALKEWIESSQIHINGRDVIFADELLKYIES